MKTIHFILRKDTPPAALEMFQESVKTRDIEIQLHWTEEFDFSNVPVLGENDILYTIASDETSRTIEKLMMTEECTSFYTDNSVSFHKPENVLEATIIHEKSGLPVIPTIYVLPKKKEQVIKAAESLGGFPLVLKSAGGSYGVGVMKVDSVESLLSVGDYLRMQNDTFIMRQYIDYKEHARLIVIGDEVVASIEYKKVASDFRSNAGTQLEAVAKDFGEEINAIAVDALSVLGFEFGGVDILIDQEGNPYIAEINMPCSFPRAQRLTGVEVSGLMIDYLLKKQSS